MKVDYTQVDSSKLSFDQINNGIEQTNSDTEGIESSLKASFTGDGAEGWHSKINELMMKIGEYRAACQNLSNAIGEVAGNDGLFRTTDKNQATRFMSINVP